MVGFYNPSVIATYLCLFSSCFGAYFALHDNIPAALICLIISGLLDTMDGAIAGLVRRNKDERTFGIQIDSLCDAFCFGVLPACIAYNLGMNSYIEMVLLFLLILAGIIRLAYYNVLEQKKLNKSLEPFDSDEKLKAKEVAKTGKAICLGMPITSISVIFPSVVVLCLILARLVSSLSTECALLWGARAVIVFCIPAMLIRIKIGKPGNTGKVILFVSALCLSVALIMLF